MRNASCIVCVSMWSMSVKLFSFPQPACTVMHTPAGWAGAALLSSMSLRGACCAGVLLLQAINSSSSLRVLAVSQNEVPVEGGRKLIAAIAALRNPKAPPSLSCNLTLGTYTVEGLDKVQWLAVQDQDALIMDAWQGLAGPSSLVDDEGIAIDAAGVAGAMPSGGTSSDQAAPSAAAAEDAAEHTPLLQPAVPGASSSRQRPTPAPIFIPHTPPSAFDVASPVPPGAAGISSCMTSSAAAAWFSCGSNASAGASGGITVGGNGNGGGGNAALSSAGSGCSSRAASGPVPPAGDVNCPTLVFVVTQDDVVDCMVRAPLLFQELDTLDLSGLGIGDEGARGMAKVLEENPAVRRVVLADNKIGEEGGAALAAAITLNNTVQVSCCGVNAPVKDAGHTWLHTSACVFGLVCGVAVVEGVLPCMPPLSRRGTAVSPWGTLLLALPHGPWGLTRGGCSFATAPHKA